jgi:NAD-dependent dihydropyrimidine dehydrogenase PreA subunit
MKDLVYLKDVVTLQLQTEKCNGCGMCTKVCPHAVFVMSEGKARIINRDHCMDCGACMINCPMQAIFVRTGVGCAAGILNGILRNTEASCGCSDSKSACCG